MASSHSSSNNVNKVKDETVEPAKIQKPIWLDAFLKTCYGHLCAEHPDRKNEMNKYCITCNEQLCRDCVASGPHLDHKVLRVYRHACKDVVSVAAMENYVDCSEIRTYICNKQSAIFLNPIQNCGSASNNEASCYKGTRKRNASDLKRFCSIACKIRADSAEPNDPVPPVISDESKSPPLEPPKKRHRRKGIPHRAPFF